MTQITKPQTASSHNSLRVVIFDLVQPGSTPKGRGHVSDRCSQHYANELSLLMVKHGGDGSALLVKGCRCDILPSRCGVTDLAAVIHQLVLITVFQRNLSISSSISAAPAPGL